MSGHFGKRLFICAMLIAIAAATNYEELKQEVQLLKQNSAKTNSEMKQLQQNNDALGKKIAQLETALAEQRKECQTVRPSIMPKSCADLKKMGHRWSGFYSVMGSNYVETVYCDFAKLSTEQGFQSLVGYSEVKSSPVYFYVQKSGATVAVGRIPFELTKLNIGGAMNAGSGIFTAPRSGIYSFAFTGIGFYPTGNKLGVLRIALMLNGVEVGLGVTHTKEDYSIHTISLNSVLALKKGDQVWMKLHSLESGAMIYDDNQHYTHFTGYLLQENVASSFNLLA